jgi:hypothetical protein
LEGIRSLRITAELPKRSIDDAVKDFCTAIVERNTAYLMGTLTPQAAPKMERVSDPFFGSVGHAPTWEIDESPDDPVEVTVTFVLDEGHHKIETQWVAIGGDWLLNDAKQVRDTQ